MIYVRDNDSWRELHGAKVFEGSGWSEIGHGDKLFCNGRWYAVKEFVNESEALTLTAADTGETSVKLYIQGNPDISGLTYRTDKSAPFVPYTRDTEILLPSRGDYVQFYNTSDTFSTSGNTIKFETTGRIACSGNVQSLLNFSPVCKPFCFYRLFAQCHLTSFPELPATVLASYCYYRMFLGATFDTGSTLKLPAEELVDGCYNEMFRNIHGTSLHLDVSFKKWPMRVSDSGYVFFDSTDDWVENSTGEGIIVHIAIPPELSVVYSNDAISTNGSSTWRYKEDAE